MCNETSWKTYRVSLAHTQLLKDKQANNKASKKYARPRREETEMPKGPHEVRVSAHVTAKEEDKCWVAGRRGAMCVVCQNDVNMHRATPEKTANKGPRPMKEWCGNDGEERNNMGLYIVRVPPF